MTSTVRTRARGRAARWALLLALMLGTLPAAGGLSGTAPAAAQALDLIVDPPSTILPPGTTRLTIGATTGTPTSCGYKVGVDVPLSQMVAFDDTGAATHAVTLVGLNPSPAVLNRVYVRCDAAPAEVTILKYRSRSAANPSYPRTGNLWGSYNYRQLLRTDPDQVAEIDLWLGADFTLEEMADIRSRNPDVLILTSINAVELGRWDEPVPDDYWLRDVAGNRLEVWPGAFRVNVTRPEVADHMARLAYGKLLDADLMFDGVFIDNVFLTHSWWDEDIYGTPFRHDANQDGVEDDDATYDAAWRAGMIRELNLIRTLLPHALISGHAQDIDDADVRALFNATSIGFDVPYVIEDHPDSPGFDGMWDRYGDWMTYATEPHITMVESAIPLEIGYGYGYEPYDYTGQYPRATLAWARDFYPHMRFGLAFTLMDDGYFTHEWGDTWHGNAWAYDELGHDLGMPLGPPVAYYGTTGGPNLIANSGFESGVDDAWFAYVEEPAGAGATFGVDGAEVYEGIASARVDISSVSPAEWHIGLNQGPFPLEAGKRYTVAFWAKADRARQLSLVVQKGAPDWDTYGLYDDVDISTSWERYQVTFTATATAADARFSFLLGQTTGTVWLDSVSIRSTPPAVYVREFENGIVVMNATTAKRTIRVGDGYRRLTGDQAPRFQYVVDDADAGGFRTSGSWRERSVDTGDWIAVGPWHNDWGEGLHLGTGEARWNLRIPATDTYTIKVWWPDAPAQSGWSTGARFEVLDPSGRVVKTVRLNQTLSGDAWRSLGSVRLAPGSRLRLVCETSAPCVADAVTVTSAARYNDGSRAETVTLQPWDGIVLRRE